MTVQNTLASHLIDLSELRQILNLARNYPSGDNCQPFRFDWNGNILGVEYEQQRGTHSLNPKHLISWMTLGFLLEGIDLAASRFGFSTEITLPPLTKSFSEERGPGRTSISFFRTGRSEDSLAGVLLDRCTDRRAFSSKPLAPHTIHMARESCVSNHLSSEVKLSFITPKIPQALRNYILSSDALLWNDPWTFSEVLKWMRLSNTETSTLGDGLPWKTLCVSPVDRMLLISLKNHPLLRKMIPSAGLRMKSRGIVSRQLRHCGAIGLFSISSVDSTSLIQCGRSAMRCWLFLNSTGNGFHPLTLPAFAPLATQLQAWAKPLSPRFQDLFKSGTGILQDSFKLAPGDTPLWMFRTGSTSPLSRDMRCPRRSLDELLTLN